jgi:hypothetical protein
MRVTAIPSSGGSPVVFDLGTSGFQYSIEQFGTHPDDIRQRILIENSLGSDTSEILPRTVLTTFADVQMIQVEVRWPGSEWHAFVFPGRGAKEALQRSWCAGAIGH